MYSSPSFFSIIKMTPQFVWGLFLHVGGPQRQAGLLGKLRSGAWVLPPEFETTD